MNEEEVQRLQRLQDTIIRVASGDYSDSLDISMLDDEIDATIVAVNILAQEAENARIAQQRAEELLIDERDAYDTAPGLFCSLDAGSLVIVKLNQTLASAIGRSKDDLLDSPFLDLVHEADRERAQAFLWNMANHQTEGPEEIRLRSLDADEILTSVSGSKLLRSPREPGRIRLILRDISEERRLEAGLRQSHKMEAVGRLAGGVAHDFNNMLLVILGNAELLELDYPEGHANRPLLDALTKAAKHSARLTEQLLAFSRQQVIAPVTFNLRGLLADMTAVLKRVLGENIVLENVATGPPAIIHGDTTQMEQVFLNLAFNARDAMPAGGELRIELVDSASPLGPNGSVAVSVQDSGVGIHPDVVSRIFDPFFTTKEPGKGTGLGLATVLGAVEQNGGSVEVHSVLGVGTRFTLRFPTVARKEEEAGAKDVTRSHEGAGTILVVEDEELVRRLAVAILSRRGYRVLAACDGSEGLKIAGDYPEPIDLVFTDVRMPGMNGYEFAKKITEMLPHLKVLFASGYPESVIAEEGVVAVDIEFIAKPYAPGDLLMRVAKLLAPDRSGT